jgi:hypothetical protein
MNAHRKEWPLGTYFIEVSRFGQRLSAIFPKKFAEFLSVEKANRRWRVHLPDSESHLYVPHGTALQPILEGLYQAEPQAFSDFPRKR